MRREFIEWVELSLKMTTVESKKAFYKGSIFILFREMNDPQLTSLIVFYAYLVMFPIKATRDLRVNNFMSNVLCNTFNKICVSWK